MAQIPLVTNRQGMGPAQYPIAPPAVFGAGIAREMDRSAEVFGNIQAGADAAESAKLEGEGSAALEGVMIEAKTSISDPEQYKAFTDTKITEAYDSVLEKASSPMVRRRLEARLSNNRALAQKQAQFGYFEKKKDIARGDLDIAFDQMTKSAAAAPDDQTRMSTYRTFSGLLGQMKANNYLSSEQVAEMSLKFDKSVLTRQATVLSRDNPEAFFVAAQAGQFDRLGDDVVLKFREDARKQIEHTEIVRDKNVRKLKEGAEQDWYSRLAQDQLSDSEIEEAAKGNNPYITPQKAIEFKIKKESGTALIGGDSTGVRAIMEEYHSGTSSFARINAARASLKALRAGNNKHNPLLDKAFNELQTDERTMTGFGMAQGNFARSEANDAATRARELYDANVPKPFAQFLVPGWTADRAKVGNAARNGQDITPMIKSKAEKQKARDAAIPTQQQKVRDLAK